MKWHHVIALVSSCIGFVSSDANAMMEDSSPSGIRGKVFDYARPEFEFRLPSRGIRAYSLADLQSFQHVLLVAFDSIACTDTKVLEFAKALQGAAAQRSPNILKVVVIDSARTPRNEVDDVSADIPSVPLFLFDSLQIVASQLLFLKAGDFALMNPKSGKLVSTGNVSEIDDQLLANSSGLPKSTYSAVPKFEFPHCRIGYQTKFDTNTKDEFLENFARPFLRTCVRCHIQTKTYDFFKTMEDVFAWRAMSLRTISLLRMPGTHTPFFSSTIGAETRREDLRKIVQFLDSSPATTSEMRKAYEKLYLDAQQSTKSMNSAFRTDLKLSLKGQHQVPSEGKTRYLQIPIGNPIESEFGISAIRLKTNLNVVHHVNILLLSPDFFGPDRGKSAVEMIDLKSGVTRWEKRSRSMRAFNAEIVTGTLNGKPHNFEKIDEPIIATFSRRDGVLRFKSGTGIKVPKGAQFAVDVHIEPSGREEALELEIELETIRKEESYLPIARYRIRPGSSFKIPSNSQSYISTGSFKTDRPILVQSCSFHAHYRAIGSRIWFVTPEGRLYDLINTPFKQLKMPQGCEFPSPGLLVPGSSTIHFAIEYDNSARNMSNPNPKMNVTYGGSVFLHEMHHPRIVYVNAD